MILFNYMIMGEGYMNKKGFTLIELLVAIVLISLLSGIGIFSYQSLFKTGEDRYRNI